MSALKECGADTPVSARALRTRAFSHAIPGRHALIAEFSIEDMLETRGVTPRAEPLAPARVVCDRSPAGLSAGWRAATEISWRQKDLLEDPFH